MSLLNRVRDLPYLLLMIPPLCWAGNVVVGRAVRGEIPPLAMNWWRWAIAALVLMIFLRRSLWRQRHLLLRHWKLVTLLAATGITSFHSAVYIGLTETTAINAAMMIAMGPILIAPMAWILIRERLKPLQGLGVLVSCVGAMVVITRADLTVLASLSLNRGDLWLLFASVCWALYSVLLKLKPPEIEVLPLLMAVMLVGTVLTTPFYIWETATVGSMPLTGQSLAVIGYVSLFASVLAYLAWNPGVNMVGPNKAGLYLHLIPVNTAILAAVFLDEKIELYHLIGVVFIVLGIVLITRFGGVSSALGSTTGAALGSTTGATTGSDSAKTR